MNIRRTIVGTGLRIFLSAGAMLAATTSGIGSAHANAHIQDDYFDSGWSTYVSGSGGVVGFAAGGRSPARQGVMAWPGGGSTSDYALLSKVFFYKSTGNDNGQYPAFYGCWGSVWVRRHPGVAGANTGQIELINTITNTYIATKTFSLPANNTNWVQVAVSAPSGPACSPWITFRIVSVNTTVERAFLVDDLKMNWGYF